MSRSPPRRPTGTTGIRDAVVAERRAQVALCSSLDEQQWSTPSLCAGWTIHELLAHTTMPFRYSLPKVLLEVVRARGDFDRMADRRAHVDAAALSPAALLTALRDNVEHPWAPPGGGPLGALSHDVIHGLDAAVAPGREQQERVVTVLRGLGPKHLASFGTDLDRIALQATDTDWTLGSGEPLRGRAQDLLLAVCGRPVPAGRLEGPAVDRFPTTAR